MAHTNQCPSSAWTDYVVMTICLISLSAFLALQLYRRGNRHCSMDLELTTGDTCVRIPVRQLPYCPKFWHVQSSTYIKDISISGILTPRLTIDWGDTIVTNMHNNALMTLPESIRISHLLAIRAKVILSKSYFAFLIMRHQGYAFNLLVCPLTCTGCRFSNSSSPPIYPQLPVNVSDLAEP